MGDLVRHWNGFRRERARLICVAIALTLACSGQVTIGLGAPPEAVAGAPPSGQILENAGGGGATCQTSVELQRAPLDLVLMIDRSLTMNETTATTGETKWVAVSEALNRFATDAASSGIGLGVGFFAAFDSANRVSCDPASYQNLVLKMGALNAQAAPLAAAMASVKFETSSSAAKTPMHVALEGAIAYAHAWATQHSDHEVEVTLVTDGAPNACNGTFEDVIAAAETGRSGAPPITTHVVAILDPNAIDSRTTTLADQQSNLQRVAVAGGTGEAHIVDTTTSQSMQDQVVAAMNAIRLAYTKTCRFVLPQAWEPNTDASASVLRIGSLSTIPRRNPNACGVGDGYFLDNDTNPHSISLCDSTCASVSADSSSLPILTWGCGSPAIASSAGRDSGT